MTMKMSERADRRTILAGAWTAPVIIVGTSAPALAVSRLENRIRFTNITSTVGKTKRIIYSNTKIQVNDGPDAIKNLIVKISVDKDVKEWRFDSVEGWGSTKTLNAEFEVSGKSEYLVTFTAEADGVAPISGMVSVKTPDWWNQ